MPCPPSSLHVYIYYRIDPAQAEAAARAVDALLALLAPHCSAPPRRLARCDDPALWMEVYAGVADPLAFARDIDSALRTLGCQRFIVGERKQESFCVPRAPAGG
jgi:hypothetical protein